MKKKNKNFKHFIIFKQQSIIQSVIIYYHWFQSCLHMYIYNIHMCSYTCIYLLYIFTQILRHICTNTSRYQYPIISFHIVFIMIGMSVCEREYACGWFLCVKSINFITVNNNNETSTCCWLYKTTNTTIIYENIYKEHKFHTFVHVHIYTCIKFYIVIHL